MDSFAVSIAGGVCLSQFKFIDSLRVGLFMGLAQSLFFALGYMMVSNIADHIKAWDHWLAFILLSSIGIKMILEHRKGTVEKFVDIRRKRILSTLAIATSIDALAVGVSFSFLHYDIVHTLIIIGLTSFVFSALGVFLGVFFSKVRRFPTFWVGGLFLIGIGVKILIEHLVYNI